MPYSLRFLILVLALSAISLHGSAQSLSPGKSARLITPEFMCDQIYYLASDSMKGRNTPSAQLDSAAAYIAGKFRDWGLQPVNGSYYQRFPLSRTSLGDTNELKVVCGNVPHLLTIKTDYVPYDFSSAATVTAPVVFAGYGITAPDLDYDDYAGLDAKGKIVLVIRQVPQKDDTTSAFAGQNSSKYGSLAAKTKNAIEHGAVGIMFMNGPVYFSSLKPRGYAWPSLSKIIPKDAIPLLVYNPDKKTIPAMHVGEEIMKLAFGTADSLKHMQEAINKDLKPRSFAIPGMTATMHADIMMKITYTQNVVGYIEGRDPALKDEVVIIGAHYDHVGMDRSSKPEEDSVFNGADDNASGTSGVLANALAFSRLKEKPRRSMLFILFTGEEKGLYGSKWYIDHPLFPLQNTMAMLNMDMISMNGSDTLYLVGSKLNPDLTSIVKKANHKTGFKIPEQEHEMLGGSDHYNFYKQGIPFVFFFAGLHPDYHTVRDNPDRVNCYKASRIASLAFYTALRITNEDRHYKLLSGKNDGDIFE